MTSNQHDRPRRATPKMKVPGPGIPWRRVFLTVTLVAATACLLWLVRYYQIHSMPNISLAGVPAGLQDRSNLEDIVRNQVKKIEIVFTSNDKIDRPALSDIGVAVDARESVQNVLNARRISDMPNALMIWETRNVPLSVTVDKVRLRQYLETNFADDYSSPREPDLRYDASVGQFMLVPGQNGKGFDVRNIEESIRKAASEPQAITIEATDNPVVPNVADASVGVTQDKANRQLLLRLEYLYKDKLIYFPEAFEIASWLHFVADEKSGRLNIHYSKSKVQQTLRTQIEANVNIFFTDEMTAQESTRLQIVDIESIVNDAVSALDNERLLEKEIEVALVTDTFTESSRE